MATRSIDQTFAALSDPTRRRIVEVLTQAGAMRVGDLVARFESSRQAVTKHLDILCDANLVATQWQGRERISRLAPDALSALRDWMEHYDRFWSEKLDNLKMLIERGGES
ncbi:MAG: metalloregulator ArsR/SmtB family transcription factor [Lysobacterales bacterium]|jgi:DNA-binding transcriptional ArsR family regulator